MSYCKLAKINFTNRARNKVTLQKKTVSISSLGAETTTWSDVLTMYAIIEPKRQIESQKFDKLNSEVTHEIIVRYNSYFLNPLEAVENRIIFKSRIFEIITCFDMYEMNQYVKIVSQEVLS